VTWNSASALKDFVAARRMYLPSVVFTTTLVSDRFCAGRETAWRSFRWLDLLLLRRSLAGDAAQRLARSVCTTRFQVNRPSREQPRIYPKELATVRLNP